LNRYKITIQYDGTCFYGWQLQKDKRTVQGLIEKTLRMVFNFNKRIPIHGSGRTDSGVHSFGQVAHFDFHSKLSNVIIRKSINSKLPDDCQIMKVEKVSHSFHSRYNAIKRLYKYQCYVGDSILNRNQSWLIKNFDIKRLNKMSEIIKGEHDFLSFSKYDPNKKNTICIIYETEWKQDNQFVNFFILGNRFLHHMVRYLVGTMINTFHKDDFKQNFKDLINKPSKSSYIHKAPAQGLFLERVFYEN
tara:strand:- start:29 stop:766 length:738 start_codon:yes stop_codon:yes gene_type:complete